MLTRLLTSSVLPYIAGAALVFAAFGGWKVRDWQCDAAVAKALEHAEQRRAVMQETIDDLSAKYETERATLDQTTVQSTNTVREIYRALPAVPAVCAADPRVARLLEDGVSRANAAAAGQSSE